MACYLIFKWHKAVSPVGRQPLFVWRRIAEASLPLTHLFVASFYMPSDEANSGPNSIAGNTGAQPADASTKIGADVQNTNANSTLQPATPAMQAEPTDAPAAAETFTNPATADYTGTQETNSPTPSDGANGPAPVLDDSQPNVYGGNFGNDVQGSFQDPNRDSNQRSDASRGEFGQQEYNQGATHGGYGNQYREVDYPAPNGGVPETAHQKYYGEGSGHPGHQHNAYRDYDGHDLVPDQQGNAVRDTPTPPNNQLGGSPPTDGRGNTQDNRNLPDRDDAAAAFQNDNGAVKTSAGYADDYGHTSGVGLPTGTADNKATSGPDGRNQQEDQRSSRGGYDNQGSQGGRSRDQQPDGGPAANEKAPAPIDAPNAPQTEGYGHGHERSEAAVPGNPDTGDERSGFGRGGSQEGNTSQGFGSQGGSYDDQNPGARTPEYDNTTQEDKARNYGQEQRDDYRPANDKPVDGDYGPEPRRNAGRDETNK
jgi:hypothetical protein